MYKYTTFEVFPYEANLNIRCIKSNIVGPMVDVYKQSTSYSFIERQIGVGLSYFISCNTHYTQMTFECLSVNGNPVLIDTDLDIVDIKRTTRNGQEVITKFTLSNKTYYNDYKEEVKAGNLEATIEVPYIRLYCNDVQVRTLLFTYSGKNITLTNRFPELRVQPEVWGPADGGYVKQFPKYLKISWTKAEKQKILLGASNRGIFRIRQSVFRRGGGNPERKILLYNNSDGGTFNDSFTIEVPALRDSKGNEDNDIVLFQIEYNFVLMYSFPEKYYSSNYRTVRDTYLTYTPEGFMKYLSGRKFVQTEDNKPVIYKLRHYGPNAAFFRLGKFTDEEGFTWSNYYISACDSIQFGFTWCEARENQSGFMHYNDAFTSFTVKAKEDTPIYANPYHKSMKIGTLEKNKTAKIIYSQSFKADDDTERINYYYIEKKGWVQASKVTT